MSSMLIHPSEFAYAFSYSKTAELVGWGQSPMLPLDRSSALPNDWMEQGAARLQDAGRLTGSVEEGLNFTEDIAEIILTLANPMLVMLAERKAGEGVRRQTVHITADAIIGLSRQSDGMFAVTRYADLMAACVASAGFVGAALTQPDRHVKLTCSQDDLGAVRKLASAGDADAAADKLVEEGLSDEDAASLVRSLAAPAASGVLSVLYCADNKAVNVQPYSVMTDASDQTWVLFVPASMEGPMIAERSSASAFAARVLVGLTARLQAMAAA